MYKFDYNELESGDIILSTIKKGNGVWFDKIVNLFTSHHNPNLPKVVHGGLFISAKDKDKYWDLIEAKKETGHVKGKSNNSLGWIISSTGGITEWSGIEPGVYLWGMSKTGWANRDYWAVRPNAGIDDANLVEGVVKYAIEHIGDDYDYANIIGVAWAVLTNNLKHPNVFDPMDCKHQGAFHCVEIAYRPWVCRGGVRFNKEKHPSNYSANDIISSSEVSILLEK